MSITVRLPALLQTDQAVTLTIDEPVHSIPELVDVLERRMPGFRAQLDDSVFNFAVNDEMSLHRVHEPLLADGDSWRSCSDFRRELSFVNVRYRNRSIHLSQL